MRFGLVSLAALMLAGCTTSTNYSLLRREVGRTVADVTLVAGQPHQFADLPGNRRLYQWRRPALVPRGGPLCTYTLTAVSRGRAQSLAAWHVIEIAPPTPGCGPLLDAERNAI
jgi:hypothetical protein